MKKEIINNVMKLLWGGGNIGYLWDHVAFFEKKLPDEIAPFMEDFKGVDTASYAYHNCHYFSAWIRLYTELICNKALNCLSRAEYCEVNMTDYRFDEAIKKITEKIRPAAEKKMIEPSRLEEMIISLKKIVELRHSFQHGGAPSIIRERARLAGVDLKDVANMVNPKKYIDTKQIFTEANELINLLPQHTITVYRGGEVKFPERGKPIS